MADFTPFWSMFHTVQMIVHFPMLGMNIPGQLALVFAKLIRVAQFNVFGVNDTIIEKWIAAGDVDAIAADAQQNAVFSQMGYERYAVIPNLGVIYFIFVILVGFTLIGFLIDTIFFKSKNVDGGSNPLTKFFTNVLLRFFMAAYLEVCIVCFIQFQNIQVNGLYFLLSSVSAVIFMIFNVGIIFFTLF
jgi:hypothetical protein